MLNLNIFSKPAHEIKLRDIEELIEAKVPEGQQIEFKEDLPAPKGKQDPWYKDQNEIGEKAKKDLSEEIVAFANAQGGTLLLGIKQSSNKPPIATKPTHIPQCVELADRLGKVFRDSVEPSIPMIEVFGVPVNKDGHEGIVIIKVGRSRLAPHWVKSNRACKIRRADRSEQMTMWEVQDMTLNVSRGLERFERRLQERSERFQQEFDKLKTPEEAFGIRLTALPVGEEVRFDNASQLKALFTKSPDKGGVQLPWEPVKMKVKSNESKEKPRQLVGPNLDYPFSKHDWQLGLRRIRRQRNRSLKKDQPEENYGLDYHEIHCDGLLEFGHIARNHVFYKASCEDRAFPVPFNPDWSLILLANLALWADCIRKASVPMAEYGIEIEIQRRGERKVTISNEGIRPSIYCVKIPANYMPTGDGIKFPHYSLPNDYSEEAPAALLLTFYRDFWNWSGRDGEEYEEKDAEIEFEIG